MTNSITRISLLGTVLALAFALFMGAAATAQAAHNADGLVGYWPLDDEADPTEDASTHSNDGDIFGGALFTGSGIAPIVGNQHALSYDGDDDYIEVSHDEELDMTDAYTLSVWVDVTDVPANEYRPIAFRGATDANDIEVYIQAVTGDLVVAHNRGNGGAFDFVGFEDPAVGGLFHLVVTFDGNDVEAYYDGIAASVTQNTTAMNAPNDTDKGWWFGKVDHASFGTLPGGDDINLFEGLLDEIRLYDVALSSEAIAALGDYSNFTVMLSPEEAINPVNSEHTVTATLEPALAGIPVLFEVAGANPGGGTPYVYTNGDGEATLTYEGINAGMDTITGCVDVSDVFNGGLCNAPSDEPSDQAVKYWFEAAVWGGGHLLEEDADDDPETTQKRKDWLDVSFGGAVYDLGGDGFMGDWQVNLHNVAAELDKSKFHGSDVVDLNVFDGNDVSCNDAVNFIINGSFDGMEGHSMTFRAGDFGSPNTLDTARVTIYDGENGSGDIVYDTHESSEFTDEATCVGTARTGLDTGNITISNPS